MSPISEFTKNAKTVKLIPLGGVGQFGMNLMVYWLDGKYIVVDAGSTVPESRLLGVGSVIPNLRPHLKEFGKLLGYVITHGHEDHIGALPHLYSNCPAPIYASPWTRQLLKSKFAYVNLNPQLEKLEPYRTEQLGPFEFQFLPVNHSIPDAGALLITTKTCRIFHTGDFKFDFTPMDRQICDESKLRAIGDKGVDVLLCDSTNAGLPGFCPSEAQTVKPLTDIIREARGRVFVTSFSSHFLRLRSILGICERVGKRLLLSGYGVQQSFEIARELGLVEHTPAFMTEDDLPKIEPRRTVVLLSGSQCEYQSALYRLSKGEHKSLRISNGDLVLFSSRTIPGNEKAVIRTIDNLRALGAKIITPREEPGIHVSGHGYQEDVKHLVSLVRPKTFVPVHGSFSHLDDNAKGVSHFDPKIITKIFTNGDVIEVSKDGVEKVGQVNTESLFIDQNSRFALDYERLRERLRIGERGHISINGVYSKRKGWIVQPEVTSAGVGSPNDTRLDEWNVSLENHIRKDFENAKAKSLANTNAASEAAEQILRNLLSRWFVKKPILSAKIWVIE